MSLLPVRPAASLSTFAFSVDQVFVRGDIAFCIKEERGPVLVLQHTETLERKVVSRESLERDWLSGILVPGTLGDNPVQPRDPRITVDTVFLNGMPLQDCTDAQKRDVESISKAIHLLQTRGYQCLRPTPLLLAEYAVIQAANEDLKRIALWTVYRYSLRLSRADGDVRAIVPKFHHRGGRGSTRIAAQAKKALEDEFARLRKKSDERIIFSEIRNNVEAALIKDHKDTALILLPSQKTVERRTREEFGPYEIMRRNKGVRAADRAFETWDRRDMAERPLEVAEFDDKDSHLFLIDERSGLPYGRAYVTSGVDQHTSVPLGFSMSSEHRSVWSAMSALTNAILPKDMASEEYALVKGDIEFSGMIGVAVFDNATYNHATAMTQAIRDVGCDPAWAKPGTPREKSKVENFNGLMDERFFATLPGYCGKKDNKVDPKEAAKRAVMTVDDFVQQMHKWVYNDYVNTPGVDGYTPRQRWHDKMRFMKPRYPTDVYRLRIAPSIRHEKKMRAETLAFCGLQYKNEHLASLRKLLGAKADIAFRYDPRDMNQVYVFDPYRKQLFIVPSANPDYTTNLSLYQHRLLRKMARARGRTNPTIPQLLEEREALRKLVDQCRFSQKMRERKFANKTGDVPDAPDSQPGSAQTPTASEQVSDLEGQVGDIDDVELDSSDEDWALPEMA